MLIEIQIDRNSPKNTIKLYKYNNCSKYKKDTESSNILNRKIAKSLPSTRTRPSPTRSGPTQLPLIRLTTPPHPLVPTRLGPPLFPVTVRRSKIPLPMRPDLKLRPRLLLPADEPRPQMWRNEPIRLRRRRGRG